MAIFMQVLWAAMLLLFFAGALSYAVRPHLGIDLLKRAAVLLAVLLIGPSILRAVFDQVPFWVLLILGAAASLAAYRHLSASPAHNDKQQHGASSRHAERRPRLPHEEEDYQ